MAGLSLEDGRAVKVILVGPRDHPKGAMIAFSSREGASAEILPLSDVMDGLSPSAIIEILCSQERAFGQSGLKPPEIVT